MTHDLFDQFQKFITTSVENRPHSGIDTMLGARHIVAICFLIVPRASVRAESPTVSFKLDLDSTIEVSKTLYGIFFEEVKRN